MSGFEPFSMPSEEELERILEGSQVDPMALLEKVKADPRAIKDRAVLAQLAEIAQKDKIEFDLILDGIKKARLGVKVDTVAGLVADFIEESKATKPGTKTDEAAKAAAYEILLHGNPIQIHQDHVAEKVRGGEKPARLIAMSGYSAYLTDDRLHADIVGSAQSGKSTTTIATLECFPEENVLITSEASPKSLYYLAHQQPERLKDAIVYIDDARAEHIPVLKTFRNENSVRPTNITVADGEFLELIVRYRPNVIASSVTPLRDLEGQAGSRAFLVSVPDATPDEEREVRAKIRQQIATSAILSEKNDIRRKTLQEMARILRDEGVRDVVIPYDVIEPHGADRRGTGQFMRLIKVSAFINQYQRPLIELQDGKRVVLATYADFKLAAQVWFDFAEGQEFKVSPKAIDVLKALPDKWPGLSAPTIARGMKRSQRTVERYLEDLYEAGIASRERITAPGMPWGYWVEPETRQKVLAQIPESESTKINSVTITTENLCREYMAKNSSDSLKDSYINFFSNNDIDIKKMYKDRMDTSGEGDDWGYIYSLCFFHETCRDSEKEPMDSEIITKNDLSQSGTNPQDIDSGNVANMANTVANQVIIRVLDDLGEIILIDGRTVNLRREDVVTIPAIQAKGLIEKGKAVEVHPGQQRIKFRAPYRSDWKRPDGSGYMRDFTEGEIIEVPADRAAAWIKRGVAEAA